MRYPGTRNHLRGGALTLVCAALIGLAACSSTKTDGMSKAEEEALQQKHDAAVDAKDEAERKLKLAVAAKDLAEDAKDDAEQKLKLAVAAKDDAEQKLKLAVAAKDLAEQKLKLAQDAKDDAEQKRIAAEAERKAAEEKADAAQLALNRDLARDVEKGLRAFSADTPIRSGTIDTITPRYRASATVDTTPAISQRTTKTGSLSGWFKTSIAGRAEANLDQLDVYSNVDAPKPVPFKDSTYNSDGSIVNAEGKVVGAHTIVSADQEHAASSAFPRDSAGPKKSFDLINRGLTKARFDQLDVDDDGKISDDLDGDNDGKVDDTELAAADNITRALLSSHEGGTFRDEAKHPFQYTYTTSGTLQGASGTYRCGAGTNTGASPCTVQNRGAHFVFEGTWTFRPSSGTTTVRVPDAEYMYFGWWSRQGRLTKEDEWKFQTFHGPVSDRVTTVANLTGLATYRGPAAGFYALNEEHPDVPSEFGEFTATATLTADFGPNTSANTATVSGKIDKFSGRSDWSLTLKSTTGDFTFDDEDDQTFENGGVTWSIGTRDRDGGTWQADFFSDLPSADRANTVPSGIAGQFTAQFNDVGSLVGAFGAEKQ